MTEEDKIYVEAWRVKNGKQAASKRRNDNAEIAVPTAKKAVLSLTTASSCATTSPPNDVANTSLSTPLSIVSSSIPISQSSTVPHLIAVSSVQPAAPLLYSSNTHPVESVSNNVLTSILPELSSSSTPASNDCAFPVLSLPSSSFATTVQLSVSPNIPPTNLQPLTPLNLSITSDDLSFPRYFTDLPVTCKNTHTTETFSFSPVSTNSNSFSLPWSGPLLHNRSFDSVGQSYPRSSTPVRSNFSTDVSVNDNLTCPSNPSSSFYNTLPGLAHQESSPNFEALLTQIDSLSRKVDTVLANQRTIIDHLMNQQPARNATPVISTADKDDDDSLHFKDPQADPQQNLEFTIAELEVLKNSKKKGTKDAHFAVILLKRYTTPQERLNCTVYGEGRKSKGLSAHILAKIKKAYELVYSNESWGEAVKAMNSHMRKYCSSKDPE